MQYINCNLCGSNDYEVLWDKTEREKQGILYSVVIRDKDGNIVQGRNVICKTCGLVYVNPRLGDEELKEFYENDYRKIYGGDNSLAAEHAHAKTAMELLWQVPGETFLDIGCSTGQLVKQMQVKRCLISHGIEPNIKHCTIAKNAGLNVLPVGIENYNPGMRFDIITMLNTLEHVTGPAKMLGKVHSLLSDNGYFLVSVPNLHNTHINIPVDAFLSNAHLYNFTPATLGMMMQQHGFKLLNVYLIPEEMGEKIYILAQKSETRVEIVFDDNIKKRIKLTKAFLYHADQLFVLKHVLTGGIQ